MYFFCHCTTSPWSKSERRLTKTYRHNYSRKTTTLLIFFIFNFQLSFAHWNIKKLFKRSCEDYNQPCSFQPGDCQDCLDPLFCVNIKSGPKCLPYDDSDPIGQ